jgi:hypothetical protein
MDHKDLLIESLLEKSKISKVETMECEYIGKVCMVRTYSAGVFYGKLVAKVGTEARLERARRVWYWEGAASLSELSTLGTSLPSKCKFPVQVPTVELTGVIEVIPMTDKAISSLTEVPVWTKQ